MNPQGQIAFQTANKIGSNLNEAFTQRSDENAIDTILSQAMNTGRPEVLEQSIGKILSQVSPQNQGAALKFLQGKLQNIETRNNEKLKQDRETRKYQLEQKDALDKQNRLFAHQKDLQRMKNEGKAPPGGISAQEVPEKFAKEIRRVLDENKDSNADELAVAMDEAKIPTAYSNRYIENRRRLDESIPKSFEADRTFHSKTADPVVAEANKILKSYPAKKGLINQHRRDIASGNVSGYGQFVADKTGWEIFRNPEAARARNAAKQYFIQSLNSLASGARPNMFLEQQLSSGQTQIGREEEANQSVLDLMEFTDDLEAQRARFISDLADQDRQKYGYVKNDVESRAEKMMIPYAEQREDEMAYTIRKRHEDELDDEKLTKEIITGNIPPDTPLTLRSARILMIKNNDDEKKAQAEAKRLGFKIPSQETYKKGL